MKISFNWLKELVALPADIDAEAVAKRLTLGGLEVESIERRGRDISGVRVAEVRDLRPHPAAERLRIVKVSTADGPEVEVACGAPNVPAPGGRVAWALPGATLPGGIKLGRKEIRGFDSPGMLCSERELGIGEGVDGILILSTEPVGADLVQALALADEILEVNVTPNRADALSHAGIAREVAALFGVTWKLPARAVADMSTGGKGGTGSAKLTVEIRDDVACPRYHATIVRNLRVAPSPLWMRLRLASCGVRPISNLVDVTNYVMLETGHPLHAFDLGKLNGGIVVRRAADGETMKTLDGVDRALESGDIVIADDRGPVALAGVMGGATSEVGSDTRDLLLEAATFDPRSVRRTAKRLGMHSEASHRFERGVDAASVPMAASQAAALLTELGGALVAGGAVAAEAVDCYVTPARPRTVRLEHRTLVEIAGFDISVERAAEKLRSVEFGVEIGGGELLATVPTFRPDVTIAEDLIEEVMRLVGYDQVPARLPAGGKAPAPSPEALPDRARAVLAALGLHEIAGWAFVPRSALAALDDPGLAQAVAVKNPISADYEVMRTSLLPGLAEAARRNLARGVTDVRLFEVGPVIRPLPGDAHHEQRMHAGGLLLGRRDGWLKPGEPFDFFDLKRVVSALLHAIGIVDPRFAVLPSSSHATRTFHPGVSAEIYGVGTARDPERLLGLAGELHPTVARRLGIEEPAFAFELHLDPIQHLGGSVRATPPPRFPAVNRDVSFWIDAGVSADAQRDAMRGAAEDLLRALAVLEDFRDPRFVPAGQKGMLWSLTYRSDERTLTDSEVDAAHARVVAAISRAFPIQIR